MLSIYNGQDGKTLPTEEHIHEWGGVVKEEGGEVEEEGKAKETVKIYD